MITVARVSSVVAVSTALICAVALPATADDPADNNTTLTVTLETGGLEISAPASLSFDDGTARVGATVSVDLGAVTVTDTRRTGTVNQWMASVSSTPFEGKNASNKFGPDAVFYVPGTAVPNAGSLTDGVLVDGTLIKFAVVAPMSAGFPLSTSSQDAQFATGILGNNTATWTPRLTLSVPDDAPADTYKATLTHSVL